MRVSHLLGPGRILVQRGQSPPLCLRSPVQLLSIPISRGQLFGCRFLPGSSFPSNTPCAAGAPMGMKVLGELSYAAVVIASDRRERGNLGVFEGAKNGEIASVATLPRNDHHGRLSK